MSENRGQLSDNSLWVRHFRSLMVAGIIGYAVVVVDGFVIYLQYLQAARDIEINIPYIPYIYSISFLLRIVELTLPALALIAYVKKMNGRFYGVFLVDWALSIGYTYFPLFRQSPAFEIYSYSALLLSVVEGISLWTCRKQSKKPPLTAILALLTIFGSFVFSLVVSFIVSLTPPVSVMLRYDVLFILNLVYSSVFSVLFILLFYLEIRRPSFAEMWDMQRSTISPQR